jgi:hypothetical protein
MITLARRTRRTLAVLGASGALAVAAPAVAHADSLPQSILTPGSTICLKAVAASGAHAEGTATNANNQGAAFAVFRNGVVVYYTTPSTIGFGADFTGAGTYKVCATNDNSTNIKVTLTLLPH